MTMSLSAFAGRAGRARTGQEDEVRGIRQLPPITEAANLAASAGFRIACRRWSPSLEGLDKTIGGELAIRARDVKMRDRANGTRGKG